MNELIIELRGNGLVLSVFEMDLQVMGQLELRASQLGEELQEAWFNPFFWHTKELQTLRSYVRKKQEYRGLKYDNMSFVEIRRKNKRRKKYLLNELLGYGQLFPMVDVVEGSLNPTPNRGGVIEMVMATGSMAQYNYHSKKPFVVNDLRLIRFASEIGEYFLLSQPQTKEVKFNKDDFLVRGQKAICSYPK